MPAYTAEEIKLLLRIPGRSRMEQDIWDSLNPRVVAVESRLSIAPTLFVDTVNGVDTADGLTPSAAKLTMAGALAAAQSGSEIFFCGNIREEITASNLLEDITIIGMANRPRHADHARDGIGTVSGASWREAASHGATTPLLKIRAQGWNLVNFLMDAPSDAAGIYLERNALSGASEYDASHLTCRNMRFVGGQSGIEDAGGAFNVSLRDCIFQSLTDGIKSLNSGVDIANHWDLWDCKFIGNTHNIRVSAYKWLIRESVFGEVGSAPNIDLSFLAGNTAGEVLNVITRNLLAGTYNNTNYIEGGGNTDEWAGNSNVAGETTAQP